MTILLVHVASLLSLLAVGLDSLLDVRVLDGQAPDVKVVTDGDNDINDEAAVNTDGGTKHHKHEGDLVDTVTKSARPPKGKVPLQDGANGVGNPKDEEQAQDVPVGEAQVDEVSGDDLTNAVGVDEAGEEGKGDEMALADLGLQVEVGNDHGPDRNKGDEAEEGATRAVATGTTDADDVSGGLKGVEGDHDETLDKVPLGKGALVDEGGEAKSLRDTKSAEHALLPEVGAAQVAGEGVDANNNDNAFNRAVDDAEGERLGVVRLPSLNVEGSKGYEWRVSKTVV